MVASCLLVSFVCLALTAGTLALKPVQQNDLPTHACIGISGDEASCLPAWPPMIPNWILKHALNQICDAPCYDQCVNLYINIIKFIKHDLRHVFCIGVAGPAPGAQHE